MSTYANPFKLPEEWPDYGIGDPFILRFNGEYYLYCSTKDFRPGIKAWTSPDLLNWSYAGLVTRDEVSTGAYAPEVTYWNGVFYLYTSPAGKGHYAYTSDSPTGPFTRATENLGCGIDGSVFVDDDGSWYFYNAGNRGIVGRRMADPLTPGDGEVLPGAFMGHWTEGPMMIKRQGTYYLTLTGNHVFSRGYRVSYAASEEGPLAVFPQPEENPLIISTAPGFHGLGHSSTVLGPDLDSYWIAYHNLAGTSAEGPPVRCLDIDRLAFSGRKMTVLGPTRFPQPAPRMPDFIRERSGRRMATPEGAIECAADGTGEGHTGPVFTAEINVAFFPEAGDGLVVAGGGTAGSGPAGGGSVEGGPADGARCGAVFSLVDEGNWEAAVLEPASLTVAFLMCRDGKAAAAEHSPLPAGFDFGKIHTIRVEREAGLITVYVDQMRKISRAVPATPGGAIGFLHRAVKPSYGFMAFTNEAAGSSDRAVFKPVPGSVEAVYALGIGADEPTVEGPSGARALPVSAFSRTHSYRLNVETAGAYAVEAVALFSAERTDGAVALEASVDGRPAARLSFPLAAEGAGAGWYPVRIGTVELPAGLHELALRLAEGSRAASGSALESLSFSLSSRPAAAIPRLESDPGAWERFGQWSFDADGMRAVTDGRTGPICCAGDPSWDDYTLEADVVLERKDMYMPFGLVMRSSRESAFPAQVHDSFFGWYLELAGGKASLYRVKYDLRELLDSSLIDLEPGGPLHVSMTAANGLISVRVAAGGTETSFRVRDPVGLPTGRIGLYSHESSALFSNVTVRP